MALLRQKEQGKTVTQICREHSISEATFYAWKNKFGSMIISDFHHLKHLADGNRRLRQLYDELSLENQFLKEVLRKK